MGACSCFTGGSAVPAEQSPPGREPMSMDSFPRPPAIFREGDSKYIASRLSEAASPVDAERTQATVNRNARKSTDSDRVLGPVGRSHALLAQSGGFARTSSIQSDVQRSMSGRGSVGTSAGNSQVWSPSRKELEMAIQAEKAKDHQDWNPDLQSEEQRLTKRLGKLNLEMKVMIGDGNCQFRAISHGLYGTQDYHRSVRQEAVEYMQGHKEDYAAFVGENVDEYLSSMSQEGTWGDELTLRAISDHWGIIINVVTSDQHNWFMRYKPPQIKLLMECFVTYIAPCHYNAIRRQTVTSALRSNLSRQTSSTIQQAMKRAFSAERSLATTTLAPKIRAAVKSGQKMDVPTTAEFGAPAPEAAARVEAAAAAQSGVRNAQDGAMATVQETANEGKVSMNTESSAGRSQRDLSAPSADHYHGPHKVASPRAPASTSAPDGRTASTPLIDLRDSEATAVSQGLQSGANGRIPVSAFAAQAGQRPPLAAKQMELAMGSGRPHGAAATISAN